MKTALALAATLPLGSTALAIHPVTPHTWFTDGGSGSVTVDEILTLVNIALGAGSMTDCGSGDANGNDQVTIEEIPTAVNNAFKGTADDQ